MSGGAPRVRLERLKRRPQFLAAARGAKVHMPVLVVQCVPRPGGDAEPTIGVGFTASRKKVGKAVARNRARRRLREAARRVLPELGEPGHDYVLIARQAVLTCPFAELERQLAEAVRRLRRQEGRKAEPDGPASPPGS